MSMFTTTAMTMDTMITTILKWTLGNSRARIRTRISTHQRSTAMHTSPMSTTATSTEASGVLNYRISQAALLSGVTPANIRFYEKEKLFRSTFRGENSYRMYSDGDIHQLRFIRACRSLDMSLGEVRTLLSLDLNSKADCSTARGALDEHLNHVRVRLTELKALEKDLKALRGRCDGLDTTCHIIEALHQRADSLPQRPLAVQARKRHV